MRHESTLILRHGNDPERALAEGQAALELLRDHGFSAIRRSTMPSPRTEEAWEAISGPHRPEDEPAADRASGDAQNGAE